MSKDNLDLWERVQKTNPANTKQVSFGRKFTAIDAYSQIMDATREFGPYGKGWGIKEITHIFVPDTTMVMGIGQFFFPDGAFQVSSSILYVSEKGKADDEFAKKLETDMITKALSRLGFNADVFMGKFDDNRYVQQVKHEFQQMNPEPIDQQKVDHAVDFFKTKIDEDDLVLNYEIMQRADKKLTNDEKMAVAKNLKTYGKAPNSNKLYTTLLKEYLEYVHIPDADTPQVEL